MFRVFLGFFFFFLSVRSYFKLSVDLLVYLYKSTQNKVLSKIFLKSRKEYYDLR